MPALTVDIPIRKWHDAAVLSVGDSVRKLRKGRKWTQAQLAKKAAVAHTTVGRVENDGNYTRETLEAIAKALGTSAAGLEPETTSDRGWHGDGVKPSPKVGANDAGNVAGLLAAREGERLDLFVIFSGIFAELSAGQPLDQVLQAAADRSRRRESHRSAHR